MKLILLGIAVLCVVSQTNNEEDVISVDDTNYQNAPTQVDTKDYDQNEPDIIKVDDWSYSTTRSQPKFQEPKVNQETSEELGGSNLNQGLNYAESYEQKVSSTFKFANSQVHLVRASELKVDNRASDTVAVVVVSGTFLVLFAIYYIFVRKRNHKRIQEMRTFHTY